MIPLAKQVIAAIQSVVGTGPRALHEPVFRGNEWSYLKECLDTTCVASEGRFVDRFESDLAAYTGARYAIAVSSGTAALHVALKLAGVKENDEVLIPDLTFVATANAVTYCGALPHFVDCEEKTMGMDSGRLREHLERCTEQRNGCCVNKETGKVIRAVVPVHVFGHPVQLDQLCEVSADHNLMVVEDAAEGLGSFFQGDHVGTAGLAGVLSFNGNKIITTGSGGAIITNDETIATKARHITRTAKVPHRWEYRHDQIGYNYRLPNINAALGCAQMEQLAELLNAKRYLFERYASAFNEIDGLELISEPSNSRSTYWLQAIMLSGAAICDRDKILDYAHEAGYQIRPIWTPLHQLPPFEGCARALLPTAERLSRSVINIPSTPMFQGPIG